jgi:hypothetical protein
MGVNVRKAIEGGGADRGETDEYGAVAGAHRPQLSDLTSKKIFGLQPTKKSAKRITVSLCQDM